MQSIDICSPKNHCLWKDLSEKVPVIASFLMLCHKDLDGDISSEIMDVISHILTTLQAPFKLYLPDPSYYPQPDPTDCLSYFPCLPQLHGNAAYEKDKSRTAQETDNCHKWGSSHPTLTPGIFTVYSTMDIKSISSQVNEQANFGLQRIKGQLANMNYSNFIFHLKLFLAMKNMDICIKQKL